MNDSIDTLLNNQFVRISIASIIIIIIIFSSEISLFKDRYMVMIIFIVFALMLFTNIQRDYGLILLLAALFIIVYNNYMRSEEVNKLH